MSFADVHARARRAARGLIALGVAPGDRVAILADTTPEWTLADLGTLCAGAVVVPVYPTSSAAECAGLLADCGARAVIVANDAQLTKVLAVRDHCPALEHVIVIDPGPPAAGVVTFAALPAHRVSDAELDARAAAILPGDAATIVYTPAAGGPPKGCVLTHANVLAAVAMYAAALTDGAEPPVVFMFLPLAHVLARVVQFVTLAVGGELAFWRGDPAHLVDDLKAARPTHFVAVPRVFEHLRAAALGGGATRAALALTPAVGERLRRAHVRALFGGRLRGALTGAAPIRRDVLDFFAACDVPILEGYGMTETCAAATLNTPAAHRPGSVGRPLRGAEVRIADDGEVLLRGPNVFAGYLGDAAATAARVDSDGWVHSGDLGVIDADGYLTLAGRKAKTRTGPATPVDHATTV